MINKEMSDAIKCKGEYNIVYDISKLLENKRSNHEIKRKIIKIIFLFIERKPNLLLFVVVNQK